MTSLPMPPSTAPRTLLGIALMLAAFFCFSVSDVMAKRLTEVLPPLEVVWLRQFGLVAVAAWLVVRHGRPVLASRRPGLQVIRGLVAALSAALFIVGVSFVPIADAVAVTFVAPFVVTVLGALVLREPVGWRRWAAIGVGFAGMLIVVRPGSGVFQPAMLLIVGAASMFAVRQVLSRVLGPVDATATSIVYTAGASTVLLTVPMLAVWQTPAGVGTWALLAAAAALAAMGEILVIRALELAAAVVLAPMQYSLIVWSTLFGWLAFGQLPDGWTLAGAAIIVASGIYTVHRERLAERRRR